MVEIIDSQNSTDVPFITPLIGTDFPNTVYIFDTVILILS